MRKLLVVGALAVAALVVLMLREMRGHVDAAPVPTTRSTAAPVATTAPAAMTRAAAQLADIATAPNPDGKVNANSDDFFDRFVERQPKIVSRTAMTCYQGGLHRRSMNQWITISFVGHIKNGEVTFSDVKAKESRLDDKELEDCMLAAVTKAHWHDDSLPDVDHYEDETTLNPERGGQKYLHDSRNDNAPPAPPDTPR
jgi:hypothetical protein